MTKERNEQFQRAREMWENEERPMGRHDKFWLTAMAEIDATSSDNLSMPTVACV